MSSSASKLLLLLLAVITLGAAKPQQQPYKAGEVITEKTVKQLGETAFFTISPISDDLFRQMEGKSFKHNCSTPRQQLRYLRCLHRDKEGHIIIGEMVVNRQIASDVLDILRQLYQARYPIERMMLIDHWDADDQRAMSDNNSSSFNFRLISHTQKVSKHGQGMAIDINPLYNPYHKRLKNGKEVVEPASGKPYLNRNRQHPYIIRRGDLCYRLFKQKGFRWGGDWKTMKDYQHFEK